MSEMGINIYGQPTAYNEAILLKSSKGESMSSNVTSYRGYAWLGKLVENHE
jgi:hypothetical protein